MDFEIVGVGREEGTHILELEGQPTVEYTHEGVVKTCERASRVVFPESSTNIKINGVAVVLTKLPDRTVLELGQEEIQDHVFDDGSKVKWASTLQILHQLCQDISPVVRAKRHVGKTTALCIRAIEFRLEGHSVNIITPSMKTSVQTRGILEGVAKEIYPFRFNEILNGVIVSSFARDSFDRYLIDELDRVSQEVRSHIPRFHGAVISTGE